MVICGDAGDALGDSLYEAVLYVRGSIKSLGADAQIEPMSEADLATVKSLLDAAGMQHDPKDFKRVASARSLITGTPTRIRSTDMSSNDHPKTLAKERPSATTARPSTTSATRLPTDSMKFAHGRQAPAAELRRPGLPRRLAVALPARGLPREMRDPDRARHAFCDQSRSNSRSRSPSPA